MTGWAWLLWAWAPAGATTWTVDQTGGGDFTTIEDALNGILDGDIIEVLPGIYNERVRPNGAVANFTLRSTDGPAATTISAPAGLPGVSLLSDAGTIEGFTIWTQSSAALLVTDSTLTLRNMLILGNATRTVGHGNGVTLTRSDLTVEDSTFRDLEGDRGSVIYALESDLTIVRSLFEDNIAHTGDGGVLVSRTRGAVTITDSAFINNDARDDGGALFLGEEIGSGTDTGTYVITDTLFQGNHAEFGGAIFAGYARDTTLERNLFCDQVCERYGCDIRTHGRSNSTLRIENNSFLNTVGFDLVGYGTQLHVTTANQVIYNNAFLNADAPRGALHLHSTDGEFLNNVVADTRTGWGVDFGSASWIVDFNVWWNNAGGDILGSFDATDLEGNGNLLEDPMFLDWVPGQCDVDLNPAPGSPLVDNGAPWIADPDLSISDIGPFGGAGAAGFDGDGDGVYRPTDCDDDDPNVYPGAADPPYDGIDADCDGWSDYDADRDGDDDLYWGGGDCDDADPLVNGIDGDGDGASSCDGDCDDTDPLLNDLDADGDGWSICDGDCDDGDSSLLPVDNDADGETLCDGDCDDSDPILNTADVDGDGWSSCAGDCDDGDPSLNLDDADSDGSDTCSGDCDDADPALEGLDVDGDGWSTCLNDCDDNDATLNLGDDDGDGDTTCDGDCDDGDVTLNLADQDGDGFTSCALDCDDFDATLTPDDSDFDGASTCAGDCDDANPNLEPFDIDQDGFSTCDGDCDDSDASLDPADGDGDGWSLCDGDCDDASAQDNLDDTDGDGWTSCDGDCDDFDAAVEPADLDIDGVSTCDGDCDDGDPDVHPGADDVPDDGIDQDCDGQDLVSTGTGTGSTTGNSTGTTGPTGGPGQADKGGCGCNVGDGAGPGSLALACMALLIGCRREQGIEMSVPVTSEC